VTHFVTATIAVLLGALAVQLWAEVVGHHPLSDLPGALVHRGIEASAPPSLRRPLEYPVSPI
jgi:hypothetical protein